MPPSNAGGPRWVTVISEVMEEVYAESYEMKDVC